MKKAKLVLFVALGGLLLTYCSKSKNDEAVVNPQPSTQTTYSKDVKSIIDSRCVSCHANLNNYAGVKASTQANLLCRISGTSCGNRMPQGGTPLTVAQITTITTWAAEGFVN